VEDIICECPLFVLPLSQDMKFLLDEKE